MVNIPQNLPLIYAPSHCLDVITSLYYNMSCKAEFEGHRQCDYNHGQNLTFTCF